MRILESIEKTNKIIFNIKKSIVDTFKILDFFFAMYQNLENKFLKTLIHMMVIIT